MVMIKKDEGNSRVHLAISFAHDGCFKGSRYPSGDLAGDSNIVDETRIDGDGDGQNYLTSPFGAPQVP